MKINNQINHSKIFSLQIKYKNYKKVLSFRAGKEGNMSLFVRRKSSEIKNSHILGKNILCPFSVLFFEKSSFFYKFQ